MPRQWPQTAMNTLLTAAIFFANIPTAQAEQIAKDPEEKTACMAKAINVLDPQSEKLSVDTRTINGTSSSSILGAFNVEGYVLTVKLFSPNDSLPYTDISVTLFNAEGAPPKKESVIEQEKIEIGKDIALTVTQTFQACMDTYTQKTSTPHQGDGGIGAQSTKASLSPPTSWENSAPNMS